MFLVLELCSGGDLTRFMQKRGGRVPEAVAHNLMQQLAAGLREMRALNLVHVSCLRPPRGRSRSPVVIVSTTPAVPPPSPPRSEMGRMRISAIPCRCCTAAVQRASLCTACTRAPAAAVQQLQTHAAVFSVLPGLLSLAEAAVWRPRFWAIFMFQHGAAAVSRDALGV